MNETPFEVDTLTAAHAYAKAFNTLDIKHLKPLLAENLHYHSQWVLEEFHKKSDYLEYLQSKFNTLKASDFTAYAEIGIATPATMFVPRGHHCVLMAQGEKDDLKATVIFETDGEHITKIGMCMVPTVESIKRTGNYPH